MKIAVLGATGQTGQQLVNQALQQGHIITAIVRNPAKLIINHENLKVHTRNLKHLKLTPAFTSLLLTQAPNSVCLISRTETCKQKLGISSCFF